MFPADTSSDNVVDGTGLTNYIDSWRNFGVTIVELMAAIDDWKNGC